MELKIGRSCFLKSAKPYPDLKKGKVYEGEEGVKKLNELLEDKKEAEPLTKDNFTQFGESMKPLNGYLVVDFSNVLAGPACGRMFAELGAKVVKLEPNCQALKR